MSFASTEWVKDLLKKVTKKTTLQPGRIDGVLYQGDTPVVGTKDLVVYVSATGNDATGDGSEAKPFKTLGGGAGLWLPKTLKGGNRLTLNIVGNYTNVVLGSLYGLDYEIAVNFVNNPTITYNTSYTGTSTTLINFALCPSVLFNSGTLTMDISKVKAKSASAIFFACSTFRMNSGVTLNITGTNSADTLLIGIGSQRSRLYIDGTVNANNLYYGVNFYQASQAYIGNIEGSGNQIGISAGTGTYIGVRNTGFKISANTKQQVANGSTLVAT